MGILTIVLWYGGHLVIENKVESGLLVSFLLYQFQLGENLRVSLSPGNPVINYQIPGTGRSLERTYASRRSI